ncbi:HlyD family efflux transporter periplasmic adaptor subunit [Massilia atriviolacea]|uniref:HlyD family efflux transporter periplasmic adaptor subunit n=1 Tax=Massilia atriviolacea TaxID=2495579 RepID=A0A430HQT0_9BURK|nr:HlyD family efflux transporter periplasmic adaptor subunit [Massilia atriviolacea]RSZ59853.1 HlyD family efflux transporter periplasmic adaptor subunit [Massilia atriviolacea]
MNIAPIRIEVIEARRSRKGGAIILARPVQMKVAAACGSAIVLVLALLLFFAEYSSKVKVKGQLVYAGGAIKAVAPQFGRIVARRVSESATVEAGQTLFDLSAERIGGTGSIDARITASLAMRREQTAQRRDAMLQQLALRAAALADQERLVKAEIAAHLGGIAIGNELVKSAQTSVDRNSTLAHQGFVSVATLAQHTNILNVERARRNALTVNLGNARASLLQVQNEKASLAAREKIAVSEAEQSLAALEQEAAEHEGRSTVRVTAPAAGTVTALGYDVGQSVPAGTVLATILPMGSVLEAKLLIPSQAKSSVVVGQQVQLRIDAFPYQKYGLVPGTVKQVELNPINDGAKAPDTPNVPDIPMYRATVAMSTNSMMMYGKRRPFEPGMTLEADVFHDRRKLIEWIVDPVVSVARDRVPPSTGSQN